MSHAINQLVEDVDIYYSREIDYKPEIKLKVYASLLLINAIFIGYFIYSGYSAITDKLALRKEYAAHIKVLSENIEKLDQIEPYLDSSGAQTLRSSIPNDDELSIYLVELLDRVYENSFKLDNITFYESQMDSSIVEVAIRVKGEDKDLAAMLNDIEGMVRLTKTKDIYYEKISLQQGELRSININLSIYKTEQ